MQSIIYSRFVDTAHIATTLLHLGVEWQKEWILVRKHNAQEAQYSHSAQSLLLKIELCGHFATVNFATTLLFLSGDWRNEAQIPFSQN